MTDSSTKTAERLSLGQTLRLLAGASRGYWAVNLVNFVDGITYFGMLNLLVLFLQHNVNMDTSTAHTAVSLFTGIVTVGMFLGGGFISDWLGVRRALALALLGTLLGRTALVSISGQGASWVATAAWSGLALIGLGEAVLQPALYAGVKEYSDERTSTMGYALLYAVMNLGIAAESLLSPIIRAWTQTQRGTTQAAAGGIDGVYWILAAINGAMLLGHFLLFSARVEREGKLRFATAAAASATTAPTSLRERLRQLPLLNARFLFFIFVLLPVRTLFAHQWLTIPDYVMRCFPAAVGKKYEWIAALNPAVIVLGVPTIAAWTRHIPVVRMMIVGTAISAASTFLLATSPSLPLLLTYVIAFSIGEAVWSSRFLEYVADVAPPGQVGAYMGLATLPWFLAKATTGLYSGRLLEALVPRQGAQRPALLWTLYGALACISPIGLLSARRWVESGVGVRK